MQGYLPLPSPCCLPCRLEQDVLKPGGGVGVVIPNWRFAWDARNDDTEWGHRWNTAPEVVCRLYHKNWSHLADLEQLNILTREVDGSWAAGLPCILVSMGLQRSMQPALVPRWPRRSLPCSP